MSLSRRRQARLSLVPGICIALALVAGAYANNDKAANDASVGLRTADQLPLSAGTRLAPRTGKGSALLGGCPASTCDGGDCKLTQSLDPVTDGENQIACGVEDVGTTANGWARCYNLVDEGVAEGVNFTVESVTFGVQQATVDGINIDVVLYLACFGCPPLEPGVDAEELARESIVVDMADEGTMITVVFTGAVVPVGVDLIVEIISVDDGTVEGEEFSFRTMSNDGGQCGPSYLRAADCGIDEWTDLADIGFPDSHLLQSVTGSEGGVATVECPDIPEGCGKGAGACGEANGSPGCEDVACCAAVCELIEDCCTVDWDQFCADFAIELGCALLPCPVSACDEGGDCKLTQSQDGFVDSGNQIACQDGDGNTTPNSWSRCYNLVEEGVPEGENLTINSVTFGVQQATTDGIDVDVVLYLDCDGCPPGEPDLDALVLATASVVVGTGDVGSMITVPMPAGTVVPAGADLIVEIGNPGDGTVLLFAFRVGSNDIGQCGPTYIRTDGSCGLGGWTDLADIAFPDSHMLQSVSATVGGTTSLECLEACGKGAGACSEPNGSPGCEDPACCALVCELEKSCCLVEWDQFCVDLAVKLECTPGPGQPTNLATGPDDNTDAYLRIGTDAFGSWTDTTFGGLGDTFNPVGATLAQPATFAQAFSIYRQAAGEQEILSTSEDLQGICGEDGTMTRTLTATGVGTDTNDDGVPDTLVSSFDVTSDGMDVSFQLTQHVELGTALGGDPVALVHLDLVITNNGPPVDFILQRHQDYDMVWAGDFLDDSVGTGTNDAKGDLFVYQGEAGDPGTHITLSSPQGDVYYGGKQNVVPANPGGCGACVAYGFGSDLQICDNPDGPGTPCCWKNHIAGVGHNTDGDSGAAVGDDASIGMEIPISLAASGVTEVSVLLTYGAKVPGSAEALPCPWDLDSNGSVGATDLLSLLVNWGPYEPCPPFKPADFDTNCTVGATDLLALLVNWGPCP